jgi:hypothetical protein
VLLGDSFVAGHGVPNSKRFSDLIENRYPKLDVMNFGLPASGTDQQLLVYEVLAKRFEADAYVFAPYYSNILRNQADMFRFDRKLPSGATEFWYRPKPYYTLRDDGLVLHNQPVPKESVPEKEALKRFGEALEIGFLYESIYPAMPPWIRWSRVTRALTQYRDGYETDHSSAWQLMRAIIERVIVEVEGKPVIIAPLPSFFHLMHILEPTYLARYSPLNGLSSNVILLDVLPYFEDLSREDRRKCIFKSDSHYSALGHQVVANAISDCLTAHLPEMLD